LIDPLFMLLGQLALHRLLIWIDSGAWRDLLASGVILGLAGITRPTILAFIPVVLILIVACRKKTIALRLKQAGLVLIGMAAIVGPITIRNLAVASDPVLIASQGGINFYIGNNKYANGTAAVMPPPLGHNWRLEDVAYLAEQESGREHSPGEQSTFWFNKGLREIADDPPHHFGLMAKKLYRSISNWEISNNRSLGSFFSRMPLLRYNPLSFGIIFALAVIGTIAGWRQKPAVRLFVWFLLCQILVTTLFFFNSRFRLPLLPFYIILASYALFALSGTWRENRKRAALLLSGLVVAAVVSCAPLVPLAKGVSTQDMLSRALMHMNRNDYAAAVRQLRQASDYNNTFPTTNLNLGICFLRQGNADSAFFYFDREKQLHPLRPKAYINTASLYLVDDQLDRALSEINKALAMRPYDVTANRVLLRASEKTEDITNDSLMALIDTAANRTDNNLFLLNEAALLMMSRDDLTNAEAILLRATGASPPPIETDNTAFDADYVHSRSNIRKERAQTYYQLGYLKGLIGAYEQSIRFSHQAINLKPDLVEAYINLVSGYVSLGQTHRADSALSSAVRTFPDNPQLQSLQQLLRGQ
jgi:tetratricopeptide (TPR) repeat protein